MIQRLFICVLISWLGQGGMLYSQSFTEPLSPRTANYDMQVYLDTEAKQVRASHTLTFRNPSGDTIRTMLMHMYYNAWKNNQTDFYQEAGSIPRDKPQNEIDSCIWSWVEVDRVVDAAGNDLTTGLRYVQPDNNNTYDHTVLEVPLAEPVLPYATYELKVEWRSQIPRLQIRTGYSKDYFFMVQWYPKLGVYEPAGMRFATEGQWNCHQYHPATEYYGEFGVYDVQLNVPADHVVGASGYLVDTEDQGDRRVHHYRAEDVIDFAWTAHPGFEVVEDRWRDTDIRLLIRPEHRCNEDRFLGAARHTLDFFADYLEPYPYPTLTIVSPPFYGLNSGAMEYPTLITAPTLCNLPPGIKTTETLVIHELTHQYFMQMLATNEQEEPWLDEGFTSYFEAKILDKYYPEGTVSWPYMTIGIGSEEFRRGRFFNADNIKVDPLTKWGWQFKHGSYRQIIYGKPAVGLRTLEGIVGEACMQKIMQTYFREWKFKHPSRLAFEAIAPRVAAECLGPAMGEEVAHFLNQLIYGTEVCDYSVGDIINKPVSVPVGYLTDTEDCTTTSESWTEGYESKAVVFRHGEFTVPQTVEIVFDDGTVKREQWGGRERSYEWVYTGPQRIVSVAIDPDKKVWIDSNFINNSQTEAPSQDGVMRYFVALVTWLQAVMVSMTTFV